MNKSNLFTVQLKLKRHKLSLEQIENDNSLRLGGVIDLKTRIALTIILPAIIGITSIILGFFMKMGLLEIIGVLVLIYVGYEMTVIKRKKENNKNIKIIRSGEIEIYSNSNSTIFKIEDIKKFDIHFELVSKETYEGKLLFTDSKNEDHVILSINDTEKRLLEDDLMFLKAFIEQKTGTQ